MPRYGSITNRIVGLVYLCLCGPCAALFFHLEATKGHKVAIGGLEVPWGLGWVGLMLAGLAFVGLLGLLGYVRVLRRLN